MSTTGGPFTYPTIAQAALDVQGAYRAAALQALAAAADPVVGDVLVVSADAVELLGRVTNSDIVGIEIDTTQLSEARIGAAREDHLVRLRVSVMVFRQTSDWNETVLRAWGLLHSIDAFVRSDRPNLIDPATPDQVPAMWARIESTDSASQDAKTSSGYTGRATGIYATVAVGVKVKTTS